MLAMAVGTVALTGWRPEGPGRCSARPCRPGGRRHRLHLQSTNLGLPDGLWVEPIFLISASFLGAVRGSRQHLDAVDRLGSWRELMVPAIFAA